MGKEWDVLPSVDILKECLRVLKDGAFALWLMTPRQDCQLEFLSRLKEAGFAIGFTPLYWTYLSGFPKAMNISKAVDKRLGAKREIIGRYKHPQSIEQGKEIDNSWGDKSLNKQYERGEIYGADNRQLDQKMILSKPASSQAKALDGSYAGFQPKPAIEVVIVSMKPLSEKSYVDQALNNGKGITWLQDCRIPTTPADAVQDRVMIQGADGFDKGWGMKPQGKIQVLDMAKGRFPANLLVSDNVLDRGIITSAKAHGGDYGKLDTREMGWGFRRLPSELEDEGDSSRYFSLDNWWGDKVKELPLEVQKTFPFLLVPKAANAERNDGIEGEEKEIIAINKGYSSLLKQDIEQIVVKKSRKKITGGNTYNKKCLVCGKWQIKQGLSDDYTCHCEVPKWDEPEGNIHATVKPLDLMSYLITLTTRKDDVVLDPFMGSGTTGVAAHILGRRWLGFEKEKEYYDIAQARLVHIAKQAKLG